MRQPSLAHLSLQSPSAKWQIQPRAPTSEPAHASQPATQHRSRPGQRRAAPGTHALRPCGRRPLQQSHRPQGDWHETRLPIRAPIRGQPTTPAAGPGLARSPGQSHDDGPAPCGYQCPVQQRLGASPHRRSPTPPLLAMLQQLYPRLSPEPRQAAAATAPPRPAPPRCSRGPHRRQPRQTRLQPRCPVETAARRRRNDPWSPRTTRCSRSPTPQTPYRIPWQSSGPSRRKSRQCRPTHHRCDPCGRGDPLPRRARPCAPPRCSLCCRGRRESLTRPSWPASRPGRRCGQAAALDDRLRGGGACRPCWPSWPPSWTSGWRTDRRRRRR